MPVLSVEHGIEGLPADRDLPRARGADAGLPPGLAGSGEWSVLRPGQVAGQVRTGRSLRRNLCHETGPTGHEQTGEMTQPKLRPFDAAALYSALDFRRAERGLSWSQVASQLWDLSADLNDRRRDHPISPSTLTNMARKPRTSCQHALFMLRWLDRTPESFLAGATHDDPSFTLPLAGPDRRLRWSLKRLYETMDEKRRQEGLTWPQLATTLGCSSNRLTALRTAKFATDMDLAMRIVQWIGRPAADFIYLATW